MEVRAIGSQTVLPPRLLPATLVLRPSAAEEQEGAAASIARPVEQVDRPQNALTVTAPQVSPLDNRASAENAVNTAAEIVAEAREKSDQSEEAELQASDELDPGELTPEQEAVVKELAARDREVRAHEQAHKTVGGRYAGAISYVYENGPDNKRYAVGGEVPIDVSPEDSLEATITKMEIVIAAALAPAEPSAADRAVAKTAQGVKLQAQAELRTERFADPTEESNLLRREEDPEESLLETATAAYLANNAAEQSAGALDIRF